MVTYMIMQVRTTSGRPIAEWVMNNRASLGLKYVIWGQKIWNPSRDAVGPWTGWRDMEDRGSITANHWYVTLLFFYLPRSPLNYRSNLTSSNLGITSM